MIVTCGEEYSHFIKETLFGRDSSWFEDFKSAAAAEDIRILGVTVRPVSESHFVTCVNGQHVKIPAMGIYATGEEADKLVKKRYDFSHAVAEEHKQKICDIWRRVCIQHNVDTEQYCGVDIHISVVTVEHLLCDHVLRRKECIAEVERYLARRCIRPVRNIYCSSSPAYNIVFTTENYAANNIENRKEQLSEEIRSIILPHFREACHGMELPFMLKVNFWHPEMPNYNGYGLARQD